MEHAYRGTRLQKCNRRYYLLKRAKPHRCTLNRFKVTECIMHAVANCFATKGIGEGEESGNIGARKRLVFQRGCRVAKSLFIPGRKTKRYRRAEVVAAFRIVLSRIQLVFVTASGLVLGLFRLIRSTPSWVFVRSTTR